MFYGENTGPIFQYSLCSSFCLRTTGLTGKGIINFYVLISHVSVHFSKNPYFALLLSWLQQFERLCVTLCSLLA